MAKCLRRCLALHLRKRPNSYPASIYYPLAELKWYSGEISTVSRVLEVFATTINVDAFLIAVVLLDPSLKWSCHLLNIILFAILVSLAWVQTSVSNLLPFSDVTTQATLHHVCTRFCKSYQFSNIASIVTLQVSIFETRWLWFYRNSIEIPVQS